MLKKMRERTQPPLQHNIGQSSLDKRVPPRSTQYFDTLPQVARKRLRDITDDEKLATDFSALEDWMLRVESQAVKSGSELAGRLLFVEIARDARGENADAYRQKLREVADLALEKDGIPLLEPLFHNDMSDAVFMNGPILSGAGSITGERKYFDACAQHVNFTLKLCKRDDGLYRHSPLCEAAWGRGNGFVAMGLALVLEDFDPKHPAYPALLKAFQEHMTTLKKHQDYTGCWHQVIDHPESYREFTCTCMIGFAMASGIRHGWLEKDEYQACVEKAWQGAQVRVFPNGFLDVCTGTGKQKTLRDYLDREAIMGPDARAASMYLMFASER
jgi:unsaturated rhamnogalacturonyl hydrolase